MSFEEFWIQADEARVLSQAAIRQLPLSLSTNMKDRLMRISAVEAANLLYEIIGEINHGSIESIEALLKKRL